MNELHHHIEVLLHASEKPLTDSDLKSLLNIDDTTLKDALYLLRQHLETSVLELYQSASGYRLQIKQQYGSLIRQCFPQRQETLSQALLETLSIIAYKQPVTRHDIEQIRGVSVSSHILRQLFDKGWIVEKGHKETLGRPALLGTTKTFLDAFGLTSLDELPPMPNLSSTQ